VKGGRRDEVYLDIRGEYGLTTVQKGSQNGRSNTGSATLLLGYKLGFGGR
jgi:hypothetical protein